MTKPSGELSSEARLTKEQHERLKELFNGPDGSLIPVWLLCEDGNCSDCLGTLPSDCACCLVGRDEIPECGCVCHKRLEKIAEHFAREINRAKREAEIKTAERFLDEPWVMLVPPKDSPDKYVWIRRHQMKDLANQIINQSENK